MYTSYLIELWDHFKYIINKVIKHTIKHLKQKDNINYITFILK